MKLDTSFIKYGIFLIVGLIVGWIIFQPKNRDQFQKTTLTDKSVVWTCSMHPQIRRDKPGKCPICGMDLIPLEHEKTISINPDAVQLDEASVELANIQTSKLTLHKASTEIRLYGVVQPDERLQQTLSSHIAGRIDYLFVNYEGEEIKKGQIIAEIYSPELLSAQQELLEAKKLAASNPYLLEAAREKLKQWNMSDSEIKHIESSGIIKENYNITAEKTGTVMKVRINAGDYIGRGQSLIDIADLSNVWILLDIYESDIPLIKKGDRVNFSTQTFPDKNFTGTVDFVDPVINSQTHVARARIEADNKGGFLKPGMFVTAVLRSEVDTKNNQLIVPASAVLWTGKRSIVYLKDTGGEHSYVMHKITLGAPVSDGFIVTNGLKEGDEIVTNGAFSVDAATQLAGKPSMMNHTVNE